MTLHDAVGWWRTQADSERRAGNERLAEDYARLADTAERYCAMAHGEQPCPSTPEREAES